MADGVAGGADAGPAFGLRRVAHLALRPTGNQPVMAVEETLAPAIARGRRHRRQPKSGLQRDEQAAPGEVAEWHGGLSMGMPEHRRWHARGQSSTRRSTASAAAGE